MSAFGITYALYVGIVAGGLVAFDPSPRDAVEQARSDWLVAAGVDDRSRATVGRDGFLTAASATPDSTTARPTPT